MKYKIALGQMDSGSDKKENLRKMREMTEQAASKGAALIAFPETADYIGPSMAGHAEPLTGETVQFLRDLAAENHITVLCGSILEQSGEGGRVYNTSLLISEQGEICASYRKLHMFDIETETVKVKESDWCKPGDEVILCGGQLGNLGMTICYDLRFPELYRILAAAGAEVIFVPANFTYDTGKAHWETLLRARAIENTCFIVAPDQCGTKPKYRAYGHSMVIGPWGDVLARGGTEEELIFCEIDLEQIRKVREKMPSLAGRRTDVYTLELNENK